MTDQLPRRPESVLVLVYTGSLDVLLLRRKAPFDFWQSVTGSLNEGESPQAAAHRELAEETGLVAEVDLRDTGRFRDFEIDPRWRDRYAPGTTTNREYEWRCQLAGEMAIRIDPAEHSEFCWLPLADAIERVWSWTNKAALKALQTELRPAGQPV